MVNKWLKKSIYGIAFVAIATVLLFNIIYINNIDNREISSIERYPLVYLSISILIAIALIGMSYGIQKLKISKNLKKAIVIILVLIYAILQIRWLYQSMALPFADSEQILVIAKGLIGKGELNPYCFSYLQYYPQQLTLSAVIAGIFKILNTTNYMVLQYANILANIFTIFGLYKITKNLSQKYRINKVLFFIMTLTFVPMLLLATFVYGDFIGLAFVIWATYFAMKYTKHNQIKYVIITAILLSIACLVRMNYFIFAIATAIYWFLHFLETTPKRLKEIGIYIGVLLLLTGTILLPNQWIKSSYQKKYNLNAQKAFSTIPYLYMGMSEGERGNGWYNNEIGDMVYHLMCDEKEEAKKMSEKCKNEFQTRAQYLIKNPIEMLKYYSKKIISIWAEPTMEFGFYNSIHPEGTKLEEHKLVQTILEGKGHKILQIYQKGLTILILVGVIMVIFQNRKELDKNIVLLCLIFLGGFAFHLLWEAKSRYILPYMIMLIPVATVGITQMMKKLETKIKKEIENKKKGRE